MKHFITVFVFVILATAVLSASVEQIREIFRKVRQAHDACNADPATQIDLAELGNASHGGPLPANLPAHSLCVSKALGWQNADGSVNVALVRSRAAAIYGDNDKLEKIVNECVQPQDTPEATAQHLFDCYRKNTPRPTGPPPQN